MNCLQVSQRRRGRVPRNPDESYNLNQSGPELWCTHHITYPKGWDLSIHSPMTTCFLYESSIVGSYSSTKWFCMSWMVRADFPTPPAPTTTNLYSVILPLLFVMFNLQVRHTVRFESQHSLRINARLCLSSPSCLALSIALLLMQLKGGQRESRISLSVRWMDGRLAGCRCCCCFWVGVALSRITLSRVVNAITEICDCLSYLLLLGSTIYYHHHRSIDTHTLFSSFI